MINLNALRKFNRFDTKHYQMVTAILVTLGWKGNDEHSHITLSGSAKETFRFNLKETIF